MRQRVRVTGRQRECVRARAARETYTTLGRYSKKSARRELESASSFTRPPSVGKLAETMSVCYYVCMCVHALLSIVRETRTLGDREIDIE